MLRLAALLLILAPSAAWACVGLDGTIEAWGPASGLTEPERNLVVQAAGLSPEDIAGYPDFWSGVRVAECDLDAAEPLEKVVIAETQITCSLGVQVCATFAIAAGPGGPRIILEASSHTLQIADTAHQGWRDLIVIIAMRPPSVARFAGSAYDFIY